jgi:hypothetical protein
MRLAVGPAILAAALSTAAPSLAQQESPHRLHWQSDWRRVNGVEYTLTTGLFAAFVGIWFLTPLETAVWTKPILLDDVTREGLRATTRTGRNVAAWISDGIALVSYMPPLLVDPLVIAGRCS